MHTAHYFEQVRAAADFIRASGADMPKVAVVLGSGLGDFAHGLDSAITLPYDRIPGWPKAQVIGHEGTLALGRSAGCLVAALAGRAHAYEGHPMPIVTFSIRVLGVLGVRTLLLTNAAGGINTTFSSGALMVIDDHINLTGQNPLVGENDERFGTRFPDMTDVYSPRLRRIAVEAGTAAGVRLAHGVYAGLLGPSYETPAEIRYLRTIGADAVGMSTVAEAIVARHMGMEVLGISCISNMAAGVLPQPLHHAEVLATTARVRTEFIGVLEGVLARI